jgi:serine/threonine protein kinase
MLSPGTKIQNYELIHKLGEGGFGSVWLVENENKEEAALKVLHGRLLRRPHEAKTGPSVADRFIAEAALIRRLDFDGFVEIVDVINRPEHGIVAYVMEVLHGSNLAERVSDIPLPSLFSVMADIASTLGQLHENDIIHRDVKASNVYLCEPPAGESGYRVKLIDFGIAKDLSQEALLESTGTGFFIGTVARMAPECFSRWSGDSSRSFGSKMDQWSLGVTFYYLLSGRMPFQNADLGELVRQIEAGERRPLSLQARFQFDRAPSDIEAVVSKILSVRPEERFSSMNELSSAFSELSAIYTDRATVQMHEFEQTIIGLFQAPSREIRFDHDLMSTVGDTTQTPPSVSPGSSAASRSPLTLSDRPLNFPPSEPAADSISELGKAAIHFRDNSDDEGKTEVSMNAASLEINTVQLNIKPAARRPRMIVTAQGDAINIDSHEAQVPELKAEAIAETFVGELAKAEALDTIRAGDESGQYSRGPGVITQINCYELLREFAQCTVRFRG